MEFESWHIWIIAMIIFILLEIFVPSFVMASIGIGCLFAFFGAALQLPLALQMVLFILGIFAGFLGIKPIMIKYAYRRKSFKTNAKGLVGRIGKVIETIDAGLGTGCVAIDGDQWKAVSMQGELISPQAKVRVVNVDSIVLTVEELKQENHVEKEIKPSNETDRLKIRVGAKTYFIGFEEVKGIYSNNKITYIVSSAEKKYIHDQSLELLNMVLPDEVFFRANRQFILNRNTISEVRAGKNGKIIVTLQQDCGLPKCISVSRLKAHAFRHWLK